MQSLEGLCQHSPYLTRLMRRYPDLAKTLQPEILTAALEAEINACSSTNAIPTLNGLEKRLRRAKERVALLLAYGDRIAGWPVDRITDSLSRFAEHAVAASLAFHWSEAMRRLKSPDAQEQNIAGLFILAMGKMGAYELNYSSDIDLICFFDADVLAAMGVHNPQEFANRLVRAVVQSLEKRTADGYVFRVDLRLRPDPGSSPLAVNLGAAIGYYQSLAQNWERAAFIKARMVAGCSECAQAFLGELDPWIWRRTIDYAALSDLASMKARATEHAGQNGKGFAGYNVKLGTGGIREIEMYAQINQLLFGGRDPSLRAPGTVAALNALYVGGYISRDICDDLCGAYAFWRELEHVLQMVDDAQTHSLPETDHALKNIAAMMTLSLDELKAKVHTTRDCVHGHYAALLANDQPQDTRHAAAALWSDHDPDAQAIIAAWPKANLPALRTSRSQRLMAHCLPQLLQAFGKSDQPIAALERFDRFLRNLPSGVQIFSQLTANENLADLFANVMASAPILAELLSKRPSLWGPVVEPEYFEPIGTHSDIEEDFDQFASRARDYQDMLNITRQYVAEQKFRLGIQFLQNIADLDEIGQALSDVASVALTRLAASTRMEFEAKYGAFPGGNLYILALGKFGAQSLTFTSDLDLVFLYDAADPKAQSSKGLSASQYYSRLVQHIISAVTALTPEGRLFELDTRLRPHGAQGPLVAHLTTFAHYYQADAWTWEYLALTRCRLVFSTAHDTKRLYTALDDALSCSRATQNIFADTTAMWDRLVQDLPPKSQWDFKRSSGGIVQIELLVQALWLANRAVLSTKSVANIEAAITELEMAGVIPRDDAAFLRRTYYRFRHLQALFRLCFGRTILDQDALPHHIVSHIQRIMGEASLSAAKAAISADKDRTAQLFAHLLIEPNMETGS